CRLFYRAASWRGTRLVRRHGAAMVESVPVWFCAAVSGVEYLNVLRDLPASHASADSLVRRRRSVETLAGAARIGRPRDLSWTDQPHVPLDHGTHGPSPATVDSALPFTGCPAGDRS